MQPGFMREAQKHLRQPEAKNFGVLILTREGSDSVINLYDSLIRKTKPKHQETACPADPRHLPMFDFDEAMQT